MDKKVLNSVRVSYFYWKDESYFEELTEWLSKRHDCIDQVALFSSWFHPPLPLETAAEHAAILKKRIRTIKGMGISCGINILSTVGHHPEHLELTLKGNYPYMTNAYGEKCLGSRCMTDPSFLEEYVGPLYRLFCQAEPDFLWIDDDVRYGHIPIGMACFCDRCVETFNSRFQKSFTRDTLREELEKPSSVELRKQWLTHQSGKIVALFRFIRKTVSEENDTITLGFMTGDRFFEGYDFPAFADALSDGGRYGIMWRPGGGAYTDLSFLDQLGKSRDIGRQCANLPAYVTSIQSEMESCPYQMLKKSPRSNILEAMMDITTGCTGSAWNILPQRQTGEPLSTVDGHFEAISKATPFFALLSDRFGGQTPTGIHEGWHIHSQAAVPGSFVEGYGSAFTGHAGELYSLGLPECYRFDKAAAFAIRGRGPLAFSDGEIRHMLSAGVFMDAEALQCLTDMGYGDYLGFKVGDAAHFDSEEIYEQHPINEGFVGAKRVCSHIFSSGISTTLIPSAGAEILCTVRQQLEGSEKKCSLGLFRNSLGGIVCASSYFPYSELSDTMKSVQMKRIFKELGQGRLPAYVDSYHRVRLVATEHEGSLHLALLNINMDRLENVTVRFSSRWRGPVLTDEDCRSCRLKVTQADADWDLTVLPALEPYHMYIIDLEEK